MKRTVFMLTVILFATCFAERAWSGGEKQWKDPALEEEAVYWYERDVKKKAWRAMDEMAVFPEKGKMEEVCEDLLIEEIGPGAAITEKTGLVIYLKTLEPMDRAILSTKLSSVKKLRHVQKTSPVFYAGRNKHPNNRLLLTGEIVVQFPSDFSEKQIAAVEKEYGLVRLQSFDFRPNTFLYKAGDPLDSLDIANRLYESGRVNYAYPNWIRRRSKKAAPNDTLFPDQWHLANTGQGGGTAGEDVNITAVWDSYQGSVNEVIAIVDDGLEIGHQDLSPNVIDGESWDYVDDDSNPTAGDHGTSCAGVAAARGFNGQGVTGAAPFAGLVGYRLLDPAGVTDSNGADALTRQKDLVDIYSNSWGVPDFAPPDGFVRLDGPGPLTEDALEYGVTQGRDGLGNIYVFAGGNGFDDDNSNYDGYANSRYTIAVAASTNYGYRAPYSEKGANILVNAPSSGGSLAITTTDRTGSLGYDLGAYTGSFRGTSSATPLVSGNIALMLEANPNLSWRDVQHILIETAEKNDPEDPGWFLNGAGYPISHKNGFGRVNAEAAVSAAVSWVSADSETSTQGSSSPNLSIPDNDSSGRTDTIYIPGDLRIEFVEVFFSSTDHTWWGDLELTLTSPDGTESLLSEQHLRIVPGAYDNWRFGSVRHFGELSKGDWTLTVRDLASEDTGTFQSWTLKIYGTSGDDEGVLSVSPDDGLNSAGTEGGPFSPSSKQYTLTNTGSSSLDWTATKSEGWVTLSSTNGTLSAGESTEVTVSINSGADSLSAGIHSDTLSFANSTNGDGGTNRLIRLTVNAPAFGNLLANPGFEGGHTDWVESSLAGYNIITPDASLAHSGSWFAWMGYVDNNLESVYQDITIPSDATEAYVQFWYWIATDEPLGVNAYDTMAVEIRRPQDNALLDSLTILSNQDATFGWKQSPRYDVLPFKGQEIRLRFHTRTNVIFPTNFLVDDVEFTVNRCPEGVVCTNVENKEDVIVDFGDPYGIHVKYNNDYWAKLHSSSPDSMVTGDMDGSGLDEVIIDFGSSGIWVWMNDADWVQLHSSSPDSMVTGDMDGGGWDEVIIDFGTSGVWVRYNDTSWVKLHPSSPDSIAIGDMDGNGKDDVIFDFGASGIWVRYNDTSWVKLHPSNPEFIATGDMDDDGRDEVIIDFGTSGIWVWMNNGTWSKLHATSPDSIATGDMDGSGLDEVIIDFGSSGVWVWKNNATWVKLHPSNPHGIAMGNMDGDLAGQDEVIIDFPGRGIWVRYNDTSWTQLHSANCEQMATGNADGN